MNRYTPIFPDIKREMNEIEKSLKHREHALEIKKEDIVETEQQIDNLKKRLAAWMLAEAHLFDADSETGG